MVPSRAAVHRVPRRDFHSILVNYYFIYIYFFFLFINTRQYTPNNNPTLFPISGAFHTAAAGSSRSGSATNFNCIRARQPAKTRRRRVLDRFYKYDNNIVVSYSVHARSWETCYIIIIIIIIFAGTFLTAE